MNKTEQEMKNILMHYGMLRRSGRYPWGSGEEPYQHSGDFLSRIEELERGGMSQKEIADKLKMTTTELRIQRSLAVSERRQLNKATAESLRKDGLSLDQITEKMGYNNDSSVRTLLNENTGKKTLAAQKTADFLKQQVDEKGMIEVGKGTEYHLNISREKLNQALYILEREGYNTYGGGVPQSTNPGKQTNLRVLCPPGYENKDIYNYENIKEIKQIDDYVSHDDGETFDKFVYPASMDSKRVKINYAEEGGIQKDGLIEIRRNVDDLSLGESRYAQVRILLDGNKYAKGMAIYSDNVPEGYDMVFNTNKKVGTPPEKVFKPIDKDPDNPFGSLIKANGQIYYTDQDGNKKLGLINKRADEGDWDNWKDTLSSQFLSKQPVPLIKKQLGLAIADKEAEFDEICALENPTLKKVLLKSFADDCDSTAVHLDAAALPGQKYRVIMPIPELKDTEVYAPTFENGQQVALVRFPHGGTFEIPVLNVNNKHVIAKNVLGNATDAIGINSKVAERLSGADFDGDTVMVIPTGRNSKTQIVSTSALKELENFNPKEEYKKRPGMKFMKREVGEGSSKRTIDNTQIEMGKISNLITDMTLKGATESELARAVKHSMVVIDAAKHELDYKQSERDNGIVALKKRYQGRTSNDGKISKGAATIISRASSETSIIKRTGSPKINTPGKSWYDPTRPEGSLIYKQEPQAYKVYKPLTESIKDPVTGKSRKIKKVDPITGKVIKVDTGKVAYRTQKSTQMADTDDARELSSGRPQEEEYASFANKMKSMANEARKTIISTGKIKYSASAKETYVDEVRTLEAKVLLAKRNAPFERKAQLLTNVNVKAKIQQNPDMSKDEIKKLNQRELAKARASVGAKRHPVDITDREWEAIQAGAVSETRLLDVLNGADLDKVRERATPRSRKTLSTAKINKISAMAASGYDLAEIAKAMNISTSTVSDYLK